MIKIPIPKVLPDLDVNAKLTLSIIGCFAASVLSYVSIIDTDGNFVGSFGGIFGEFLIILFGKAAFLFPFALFWSGIIFI